MDEKPKRVVEESVIVALDEYGDAAFVVRRAPTNHGKVELYRLVPLGFAEIKNALDQLTHVPFPNTEK